MSQIAYTEIKITTWDMFKQSVSELRSWAFRGQSDAKWPMYSSLSRYFINFGVHQDAWSKLESRSLRVFKRKSHLFLEHLPEEHDAFEWLGLMQHHGTPTRLLDFTWSPYVAAFFALERATSDAAVWAVFPPGLNNNKRYRTIRVTQKDDPNEVGPWVLGNYESHFLENKESIVVIGEPRRMNQRLIAQSGTFVIPGRLDLPAEQIIPLEAIQKFIIDTAMVRETAMRDLYNMNINNATLFPGLDGMARSLAFELENHWGFNPKTMEVYPGFSLE
jgi:FRG domain